MYNQREPSKYGSTYLPRQSSNSRRFKNGQRPFMSKPSDCVILSVLVIAAGVASMWFISRLPFLVEGASSFYDWATDVTVTWGTPSMWWLFVNLIVGAIVLSSGFVSAFGSNSGSEPYQQVYIEKDVSDPAAPVVPLDSSSDYPEDDADSFEESAYRSYVPPAKPKAAVPYTPVQPVYEATVFTEEVGAEQANSAENVDIQTREIPAPTKESVPLPEIHPVLFSPEPARSVEVQAVEPEVVSSMSIPSAGIVEAEPEEVSMEPEVVLSRSIPSAVVAPAEQEEVVAFPDEDKVRVDEGVSVESNDAVAKEFEDVPGPAFYDPFTTIDDPPISYGNGKLQRNFTETSIKYARADEPLISAPPPKAELVKAHTFTSGRANRRDQIDNYVEPLARKLEEMKKRDEEMKRRDEINRKSFHSEATRIHNKDVPVEMTATRPAKVHSRNSSVDVASRDIPHSYPTEVFYPPPVQSLPAEIAHYFSSAHQAPPGEAELSKVTPAPAPAVMRPAPKKPSPADVPERPAPKKTASAAEVPDRVASNKASAAEVPERPLSKKTAAPSEVPERMSTARKTPSVEVSERPPSKPTPPLESLHRPPTSKKATANETSGDAQPRMPYKKPAALEALADKLSRTRRAPAEVIENLQRPASKRVPVPGGAERDPPKQTQTEGTQRPPRQSIPVQIPVPPPPVIKVSSPPSPPDAAPIRKQASSQPPPADDFSPPTSPPMLRPMPPPPPPHFKIPPPLEVKDPSVVSSDEIPAFKFYKPTEGRNISPKQEASSSADASLRSARVAIPAEEVYHVPAPETSSVRSFRTDSGPSTSQNVDHPERSNSRRTKIRPPPEPSVASDSTESEITEEPKEPDALHQKIESFLARMHEDMRLQRQESMARNRRINQEFGHDD
ncbi:hypothetical protein MPTK1_1g23370 [Marchantia polymorpha subsp. ruderalis]